MMNITRSQQRSWAWLLAMLLLSPAGRFLTCLRPAGSACCITAHACCCTRAGLGRCCCDGHQGAAAQFASLSTCAGGSDVPAALAALPPAVLPSATVRFVPRPIARITAAIPPAALSTLLLPPLTPPPQVV